MRERSFFLHSEWTFVWGVRFKLNPQHTIPTLVDEGFVLWDSHAIMGYLVTKYGKSDSLYPKDPQVRAKIDQFLHFETGYLFNTLRTIGRPMFLHGEANVTADKIELLNSTYEILENLLEGRKWMVGDSYTLADISCVSTLSSLTAFRPLDKYPNIQAWLKNCEETLPNYAQINLPGNQIIHQIIGAILKKPL
ncbi:glutathione S-transferase 1-like isoform X2 [Belonocnema kinseyi]|uniref:glutathione S-transferase 1-like isoform X2 n=1 Tax=Belonocnema kinseyi TaxID=2817044 RepID=UPI00143D1CB6|nr:glutathione S-transferase 1-like isoform X2 [Belonocnema kinseyi]